MIVVPYNLKCNIEKIRGNTVEQLKNYIYMDMSGIDSLLSQITSEVVETNHIQTTNRKAGSANGNLGLSEWFKKMFKGDIGVSGEIESVQIVDKTTTQPYEAKIQQIVQYIEKHEGLLKDRAKIQRNYKEDDQNFVLLTMPFDTDFYYSDWSKTVELVKQYGYIPFYKGGENTNKFKDTYQYDDSYYRTMDLEKVKLTMNLSINKMEPLGGLTSHLATLFRETKGTNIRLGVFGHIYKLTKSVHQIKPYAVWRA